MEAVSAGAGVLAFLGLALKSTKALHEILSAVRDGPQNVQSLANEVEELHTILDRLSHLQTSLSTSVDLTNLTSYASRCAADTGAFEEKLKRLDLSVEERRIGRLWRRLRIIISENDLKRMQAVVHNHIGALNFELGMLQIAQLSDTTRQSSEILTILKQLKSELADSTRLPTSPDITLEVPETPGVETIGNVENNPSPASSFSAVPQENIERLISIAKEKQGMMESDDAEELICDLQTLLESTNGEDLEPTPQTCYNHTYRQHDPMVSDISKELKLARSLIQSAPAISVNGRGTV